MTYDEWKASAPTEERFCGLCGDDAGEACPCGAPLCASCAAELATEREPCPRCPAPGEDDYLEMLDARHEDERAKEM